jgi:hypothetical protein
MDKITISSLQINNHAPEQKRNLDSAIVKISSSANGTKPIVGVSIYEVYGLEKGFSENISAKDQVSLSPLGQYLSHAEQAAGAKREIWANDPGRLLNGKAEFDEAFKEVESADGGLIFRRFNADYLNHLQSVPDALLVYDYMARSDSESIVVTSGADTSAIVLKLRTLAAEERYNSTVNMANKTSNLYDAHADFTEQLIKDNPSLKGVEFGLVLSGDKLEITGGNINGKDLTNNQIANIEQLANGKAGDQLRAAILSLREEAINYYNKYTESGRTQPITNENFAKRFGDFSNYLKAFASASDNHKVSGPDDPNTYRIGYFSHAIESISARLSQEDGSLTQ